MEGKADIRLSEDSIHLRLAIYPILNNVILHPAKQQILILELFFCQNLLTELIGTSGLIIIFLKNIIFILMVSQTKQPVLIWPVIISSIVHCNVFYVELFLKTVLRPQFAQNAAIIALSRTTWLNQIIVIGNQSQGCNSRLNLESWIWPLKI